MQKNKNLFLFFFLLGSVFFSSAFDKSLLEKQNGQKEQEEAFFAFAKTYGYIRYFYPGDEAAAIDWDRFAWYGANELRKVIPRSLAHDLKKLFSPIVTNFAIDKSGQSINDLFKGFNVPKDNAVYWQHLGDGKGRIGFPYKSMRVNRPAYKLPESSNDYGTIRKLFDPKKYQGRKIRLSGKLMVDGFFIGTPSIVISVKEYRKDRKQVSSAGQSIVASSWTTHQVSTQLPDSLEQFGIVAEAITQTGSVGYDDLIVETEENGKWMLTDVFNFEQTDQQQLLNEWRPVAANQDISIQKNSNNTYVLFSRTNGVLTTMPPLFDKHPDELPFIVKDIGSGLKIGFPLILTQKREQTFPAVDPTTFKQLQTNISQITNEQFQLGLLATRIANVIILWNRLQHFHPDNPYSTEQWENKLRLAIRKSFTDQSLDDHRKTLTQMVKGLNDSHMTFYISALTSTPFYPPFQWDWVENKLVITQVLNQSIQLNRGDIIEKVNGQSAEKFWNEQKRNVIGATESRQAYKAIEESLSGENGSILNISVFAKNGQRREIKITRNLSEFLYTKAVTERNTLEKYQVLKPGLFYINLDQITWEDLKTHLKELATAKGIVFDLRGYPKWRTIEIISHFIKEPIVGMKFATPRIVYPDRKKVDFLYNEPQVYQPLIPHIAAKKVFLTNGRALSYAEDFMQIIEYYKLATIVGDYTAGTTGTINMSYLYGGLLTPWTGMRVIKQDGTLYNGKGVKPDIILRPTIQNVSAGKDDCIEYVMKNIFD